MKKIRVAGIVWCLLLIPSLLGFRGCGTQPLLDGARQADGKFDHFVRAFANGGSLIVEYVTRESYFRGHRIPANKYWAEIDMSSTSQHYRDIVKIHREPLPVSKIQSLPEATVRDVTELLPRAQDGFLKVDTVMGYISSLPSSDLPLVIFHSPEPAGWKGAKSADLFVYYVGYATNPQDRQIHSDLPFGAHIPSSQYLRLALLWPFAVLYDWVTLPFLLLAPRIDG
jgi:hypothetical protein